MTDPRQIDLEEAIAAAKTKAESDAIENILNESEALAAAVIKRLEQADIMRSPSPGVLRSKVYETLADFGVNVQLLVADCRKAITNRAKARIRHVRLLKTMAERRLASGEVAEAEIVDIKAKLLSAPQRIRAFQDVIDKVTRRPKYFSHTPTPERWAKSGEPPRVIRTMPHAGASSPKAYRFDGVVEKASRFLTADEEAAIIKMRKAWENRTARPAIGKAAYGLAAGRTRAADRLGLTETQQNAARLWRFYEQHVPPPIMDSCKALIIGEPDAEAAEEWGKRYILTNDGRRATGGWEGALKTLAQCVAWYNIAFDQWQARERAELAAKRATMSRR